ncbi:TPR end-of-group domain-containing protein [Streptomyces sp. NPDC057638]|uniref:TPR end-of-group domain-containing protein n=1 Tax=Streptomyces sp. NPDC057638 TaxID=3346190 RepID=UPI003699DE45
MQIKNFASRDSADPAGLLVLRFAKSLDRGTLRALCDALVARGIVDPAPDARSGELVDPEALVEVVGLPWRPPAANHADTQRRTLVALGEQFAVRTASFFQAPYGLSPEIRSAYFPESLTEVIDEDAETGAAAAAEPVTGSGSGTAASRMPVWRPTEADSPFPLDGYPAIIEELDWYDLGCAVKLGGPRLAGEEQVLRAFQHLWIASYGQFRHEGLSYDPVHRSAGFWIDRWSFPGPDEETVHHLLWIARSLHEVLPLARLRFQGAGMVQKYGAFLGDTGHPCILAGNPLREIFHAEGEASALAWTAGQTLWSVAEIAAMVTEVIEEQDPTHPDEAITAIRLAEWVIALDGEQDTARAYVLFALVGQGRFDEALGRVRDWERPGPAVYLAQIAEEHMPDRVPAALAAVPMSGLSAWATGQTVAFLIRAVVEHAPDRLASALPAMRETAGGVPELAECAHELAYEGNFVQALTIYDAIIDAPAGRAAPMMYQVALWAVQADNNHLPVQPERHRRYLRACVPHGPANWAILYNAACVWIELGEVEETLECLRLARACDSARPYQMRDDRSFRSIAHDLRFQRIFEDLDEHGADEPIVRLSL